MQLIVEESVTETLESDNLILQNLSASKHVQASQATRLRGVLMLHLNCLWSGVPASKTTLLVHASGQALRVFRVPICHGHACRAMTSS